MEAPGANDADPAASAAAVSLPSRPASPLAAVTQRMVLALGLLAASAVIVYLGRSGYRDAAHPRQPLSVLACVYYAAVALSTTGFGDIVPVSNSARLVNMVLITPIRVIFLIVLVGTTLEVLTQRTRTNWRITRWRSKMTGSGDRHRVRDQGPRFVRTLSESGVPTNPSSSWTSPLAR